MDRVRCLFYHAIVLIPCSRPYELVHSHSLIVKFVWEAACIFSALQLSLKLGSSHFYKISNILNSRNMRMISDLMVLFGYHISVISIYSTFLDEKSCIPCILCLPRSCSLGIGETAFCVPETGPNTPTTMIRGGHFIVKFFKTGPHKAF